MVLDIPLSLNFSKTWSPFPHPHQLFSDDKLFKENQVGMGWG